MASLAMCVYMLFVFFFKQKTAYEMRISDWSSDVCSSDLKNAFRASGLKLPGISIVRAGRRTDPSACNVGRSTTRLSSAVADCPTSKLDMISAEIGRASCRERVCQYV